VSLTFHSDLGKLNTKPSIGASRQASVHLAKQFQRRRFLESKKSQPRRLLKIKHLELIETNGIYGYRSHNFNIIPRELDSTGKKIETDTTRLSLSDEDNN
jgi:hypothetical protein